MTSMGMRTMKMMTATFRTWPNGPTMTMYVRVLDFFRPLTLLLAHFRSLIVPGDIDVRQRVRR